MRGWSEPELQLLAGPSPQALTGRLAVLPAAVLERAGALPLQPAAGSFLADGDGVLFVPRFPFVDGARYALVLYPEPGHPGIAPATWEIERPRPATAPVARVTAIYPGGDELPLNLLKLYICFSERMSEGQALRFITVQRADTGEPLDGVFLPSETELWDREHRRLTMLLDPGRIKRGLVPNAERGYPLLEGVPVLVRVDTAFRDAAGRPLCAGHERRFVVGPAVRRRLDPAGWLLDAPPAGSRQPLSLAFDRPLDRALLEHSLLVCDAAGAALAGEERIGAAERSWSFVPAAPWRAGAHLLLVDTRLEDLAGNSPARVFDRDLERPKDDPITARQLALRFTCEPPAE